MNIDTIIDNGGATLDPTTFNQPTEGYAIGLPGYEKVITTLNVYQLRAYRNSNASIFATPGTYIGCWLPENDGPRWNAGDCVLDVTVVVNDLDQALALAREWGQEAIFNLATFEEIYV